MTTRTTREQESRRRDWRPPNVLETPTPPDGMAYRWVRVHVHNTDDNQNVAMARQEGWEFVKADDPHFKGRPQPAHMEGRYSGIIGVGDLALAQAPAEVVEQRREYEDELTRRQETAVNNDLLREQHPSMPIIRERHTEVSGGKRRARIQGD